MKHKHPTCAHSHRWWNTECAAAVEAIQNAAHADEDECHTMNKTLKQVTHIAKSKWVDDLASQGNVWEVAKWCHGRQTSNIAALKSADGTLTFDSDEMADLLAQHFFVTETSLVKTHQCDNLLEQPMRQFQEFTNWEFDECLTSTSNMSAPGESGISWAILVGVACN
jgi:hypothetical protein